MKNIFEIRTNAIYQAGEQELVPLIECILVHTDGKKYESKADKIVSSSIVVESRFTLTPETLDKLIGDLQKVRMQMNEIKDNCQVINHVVSQLNKPKEKE